MRNNGSISYNICIVVIIFGWRGKSGNKGGREEAVRWQRGGTPRGGGAG